MKTHSESKRWGREWLNRDRTGQSLPLLIRGGEFFFPFFLNPLNNSSTLPQPHCQSSYPLTFSPAPARPYSMHPPPFRASWTPITPGFPAAQDWSLSNTFKLISSDRQPVCTVRWLKDTSALPSFFSRRWMSVVLWGLTFVKIVFLWDLRELFRGALGFI